MAYCRATARRIDSRSLAAVESTISIVLMEMIVKWNIHHLRLGDPMLKWQRLRSSVGHSQDSRAAAGAIAGPGGAGL
jgi:hypothetical protein